MVIPYQSIYIPASTDGSSTRSHGFNENSWFWISPNTRYFIKVKTLSQKKWNEIAIIYVKKLGNSLEVNQRRHNYLPFIPFLKFTPHITIQIQHRIAYYVEIRSPPTIIFVMGFHLATDVTPQPHNALYHTL